MLNIIVKHRLNLVSKSNSLTQLLNLGYTWWLYLVAKFRLNLVPNLVVKPSG